MTVFTANLSRNVCVHSVTVCVCVLVYFTHSLRLCAVYVCASMCEGSCAISLCEV